MLLIYVVAAGAYTILTVGAVANGRVVAAVCCAVTVVWLIRDACTAKERR
ncbi:hypothetical protein ABTZ57_16035 [Streptomyces sp. NPDC094048]